MPKWGVEFVSPDHEHRSYVEFSEAWDKTMPMAWQVRRSELDELLFRQAASQGATCIEGARARKVDFDADGANIEVDHDDGRSERWRARYVVDATGRDTLLANQFRCKHKNPRHSSAALYGHFTGAERLEGKREGNITIFWFKYGWFWFIPLADGATSVGAVCWPHYLKTRDKPVGEFFRDTIALCPALQQRLAGARLIDDQVQATGNYSYSADRCTGDRYVLLGDAYAFIDPVFSSGVLLAMKSAFAAVDLVEATLDAPARAPAARKAFEKLMRHGPREFSWFIFRVTNPTLRDFFMYPANPLRVKEALLSLLAGDIYGKTPIWGALRILKALYYLVSLQNLGRTWRSWQARKVNIRDVGALNP
jgi:flavin-dependent dehydrogenase